jgi:hypothetical protein
VALGLAERLARLPASSTRLDARNPEGIETARPGGAEGPPATWKAPMKR